MGQRKRKRPGKHTVHPSHSRYKVTNYERGSGPLSQPEHLRDPSLVIELSNPVLTNMAMDDFVRRYDKAESIDEKARIVSLLTYAKKEAKKQKLKEQHRDISKTEAKLLFELRRDLRGKNGWGGSGAERSRFLHDMRTPHAQKIDESLEATEKHKPGSPEWEANMNRSDIKGVDFFPVPLSSELKGRDNYEINNKIVLAAYEDHVNHKFDDIEFHKGQGKGIQYLAQHSSEVKKGGTVRNRINYSIPAWKIIESGKVDSTRDFNSIKAIAHELGHSARGDKLFGLSRSTRHAYHGSTQIFEEGSNEITAFRFTFHSLQIPRSIRSEIRQNPTSGLAYQRECQKVADLALLVNDGDERKAIIWIESMRTEPEHKVRIQQDLDKSKFFKTRMEMGKYPTSSKRTYTREYDSDYLLSDSSTVQYILEKNGVTPTWHRRENAVRYPGKQNKFWYLLM